MKTFHLFQVEKFPEFEVGESRSNAVQYHMFGQDQQAKTSIRLDSKDYLPDTQMYQIKSDIKHTTPGFIRTVDAGGELVTHEFSSFLESVDFSAYYSTARRVMLMQTHKRASKAVAKQLQAEKDTKLQPMEVDFAELNKLHPDYDGAWFKGVSAIVRSAGITGKKVNRDRLFKDLHRNGVLSCVTIKWTFGTFDQSVMITGNGGIVLINDISSLSNVKDVEIALDVFDKLVSKVWKPKPTRKPRNSQ